jgi:hypothetical protein
MTDKVIEIGRCYGMEMNVEKTKVMRISRRPTPVAVKIDQKQLENVKCFRYLGRCKKLSDDLGDRRGYCHLKEDALDRIKWRNRFGRGCGPVVKQNTDE